MNYRDADSQCKSDGSFLAIPRSEAENGFIASLLPNDIIWIGINDIEQEGSFVAVDGSEISWTNWLEYKPDGGTSQNGVAMSRENFGNGDDGRWYDFGVSNRLKFVCSIYIEGIIFPI